MEEMHATTLELCKTLFELSGWDGTNLSWYRNYDDPRIVWASLIDGANGMFVCPAYDFGYLLHKLPKSVPGSWSENYPACFCLLYSQSENQWCICYQYDILSEDPDAADITEELFTQWADIPEDAVCQCAIEMFQLGVLKRSSP